jgi:hypothetical protein
MLHLITRHNSEAEGAEGAKKAESGPFKEVDEWSRQGEVNLSGSMTRQVCNTSIYVTVSLMQSGIL